MPDLSVVLLTLDLLGVFFFAVSGSLLAERRCFDIIGSLFLAFLVGLGGGLVRDLVIDQGVPNCFRNPVYLVPPVVAAALVYSRLVHGTRLRRTLLVFDAAGLALFCVTGTQIALDAGLPAVSAALLGVVTAVGGGLLRDVVANETPQIFNPKGVYAVPALGGAALTALLERAGALDLLTAALVAAAVFCVRLLALRFGWSIPRAVRPRA